MLRLYIAALAIATGFSQSSQPSFEVASVKKNSPLARSAVNIAGNRFAATAWPLLPLLMEAYLLRDFQIIGGPDWMMTDQWDIEGRAPEGTILRSFYNGEASRSTATRLMLQSLIEERFRFRYHRETRQGAVYELSIARGGLKITPSTDQTPVESPLAVPPPGSPPGTVPRGAARATAGYIETHAQSFANFAYLLGRQLDRPLIDRTNLQGLYDVKLKWTRETPSTANAPLPSDPPSLFTAIEEQLGLRLQGGRGPIEVLVIDSVEKPAEN
jgi:uncharacterized protein (TIGR03435 family)